MTIFDRISPSLEPVRPDAPRDTRPSRALFVIARDEDGNALGDLLSWQGSDLDYEMDNVGQDRLLIDSIDVRELEDGVHVWEGRFVVSGTSDWPGGGAEYSLEGDIRRATAEEWRRVVEAEDVWEPEPEPLAAFRKARLDASVAFGMRLYRAKHSYRAACRDVVDAKRELDGAGIILDPASQRIRLDTMNRAREAEVVARRDLLTLILEADEQDPPPPPLDPELARLIERARHHHEAYRRLCTQWAAPFRASPAPTLRSDAPHDVIAMHHEEARRAAAPAHARVDALIHGKTDPKPDPVIA